MESELIKELDELARLAEDPDEVEDYKPATFDFEDLKAHRVVMEEGNIARLAGLLRGISWIAMYENGMARNAHLDSHTIFLEGIAHWLLAQTRLTSAENALRTLHEILGKNSDVLLDIVPVWGFTPKVPLPLDDGMVIVPIEDLPPSRLRDYFLRVERHKFSSELAHMLPQPGSALIKTAEVGPIYHTENSEPAAKMKQQFDAMLRMSHGSMEEQDAAMTKMGKDMMADWKSDPNVSISEGASELLSVIALVCPNPIFAIGQWYQRPNYLPLVSGVKSYGWPRNEHPFCYPLEKQEYEFEKISSLLKSYQALPVEARRRMKTPLSRLNEARMQLAHRSMESAAMDLGVAAEAMLTQDRDKDAPISFLLRVRGALLLGGSSEERRENYRSLREIYDFRSKVAHNGTLIEPLSRKSTIADRGRHHELRVSLNNGVRVCIEMAIKIIARGGFPKWDDLLLGIDQ